MKCAAKPDGPICQSCGGECAPSGVDGGSWVHFDSKRPDRVLVDHYAGGVLVKRVLANGVIIRPKTVKR